jgi:hypothetical protein
LFPSTVTFVTLFYAQERLSSEINAVPAVRADFVDF